MKTKRVWHKWALVVLVLTAVLSVGPVSAEDGYRELTIEGGNARVGVLAQNGGINVEFLVTDPRGLRLGFDKDPRTGKVSMS